MAAIKDEKGVKARVKKLLDEHDWFWWMPPANGFGSTGISDFNAIKDGVFMAVETKFGSNRPTTMQKAYLNSINAAHCFGFVVNDKTLEWFEGFLKDFEQSKHDVAGKQAMSNEVGPRLIDATRAMQAML